MILQFYDSKIKEKRTFTPINGSNVRMYVCGPTVYDFAHIGNARPVIVFDVLFRLLRAIYQPAHVTYVRNITDVDDKINARAKERGISIRELTEETYKNFRDDVAALRCLEPTHEPRATDHINEMRAMINTLLDKGFAYIKDEHVLYDVAKAPKGMWHDHGDKSRLSDTSYKNNPNDFVLWKPSLAGEPAWPSPGNIATLGRPGWHIECSAMAAKYLGQTFDIHGGGVDLQVPHHANEQIQSCSAHNTTEMANFWLHNGFVNINGGKMAKSEGNMITIRELLADWPGEVIRFNMLRTHYRYDIDWTIKGLGESYKTLAKLNSRKSNIVKSHWRLGGLTEDFKDAITNDLNTPQAIAVMHTLEGEQLNHALHMLGLDTDLLTQLPKHLNIEAIEDLITERAKAREEKNYAEADRIRDQLLEMGITLKDVSAHTEWTYHHE